AQLGALLDKLGGEILGLDFTLVETSLGDMSNQLLDLLLKIRAEARKQKQFQLADMVRNGLTELGFELMDKPDGTTEWKKQG
ncbi:cysteine--tRNA ligase, partial [bacterium]|nr:cysteine--tRNA ligase [bacterium]